MGRGGGGSHSHSHSHHSSSHSHRSSGSYRSSGSSGSSHSSSYRHSGKRYYGSSSGGGSGCSLPGCSVPMIIIFGVIFVLYGALRQGATGIERSTILREPLPASQCEEYDSWYQDNWGDWIDESGEEADLVAGLEYFYDKTGVQPYLYIMGEEGEDYMSEGSIEEFAEVTYKEMFGEDEGHLLVVFREYPNASSNYIVTATPGYDAESAVMDEQAREILLDYIDYYYTDTDLNEGEFFSKAFENAASRIMTKQMSIRQIITIVVVACIAVAAVVVVVSVVRKSKEKVARNKALEAKQQANKMAAEADKAKTEFEKQQYDDALEKEYVAVTCPNCAASGNKIRKGTVGYCAFCGSAIKVDEAGNVTVESPDSEGTDN
ncbi:MAG: TPM domain-containing protein [Saccharofermentans sp.]|nr:TPM domain-containing protein [Saccharofermentans sp.]